VNGADCLFEELLVAALRRRGVGAWGTSQAEAPPDEPAEPPVAVAVSDEQVTASMQEGSPCVLLVERDDRPTRRRARLLGARACIARDATPDELVQSIVRVGNGEDLLTTTRCDDDRFLTSREIDVLLLMAAGHDNAAIAQELDISPHTARTHVQRILTKFDVRSRFSAVFAARGRGLLRSHT
jgi:DNA-binding NarL/FixJ family response regulator